MKRGENQERCARFLVGQAFGKAVKEHIQEYGEGNDKRLTGKHETCDINTFKSPGEYLGAGL